MNLRHRNGPWRGNRSNAMSNGGVAFGSPQRNRRVLNSEQTNNDRGGYRHGGTRSRPFQSPELTKNNIFVEAGRLAAEYLISRGVLPQNVMQGNLQNGEVENRDVAGHSLSRSVSLDTESSRRRRSEYLSFYGSEANSESEKSGMLVVRSSMNDNIEGSDGRCYDQDGIGGLHNSSPDEPSNREGGIILESDVQKCNSVEDGSTSASLFNNEKSLLSDASVLLVVEYDDNTRQTEEPLEDVNDKNKITYHEREHEDVPIDSRSLITKSSDNVQSDMKESEVSGAVDVSAGLLVTNPSSNENQSLRNFISDVIDNSVIGDKPNGNMVQRSGSLSGRSVCEEQQPDAEGLTGFDSSSSLLINKSSKRTLESDDDSSDSFKRLREWFPTMDTHVDSAQRNQLTQQENLTSQSDHVTVSDDQKGLNVLQFPKGHTNSSELLEEKQFLSGSFQTWDLNLLGTSDSHEKHDVSNPVVVFPHITVPETGKEVVPIEVDLSMSTNREASTKKGKRSFNSNDIEVIDLEDECALEDTRLDDPKGRGNTAFADLDGFHSNTTNVIPSVQGGCGHMMTEQFGNGSPNSSSVAANFNSLPSNTSLSNGEGILGDDDPIYMSLGEIPSSQLGSWEHPNQDYRKSF